MSNARSEILGRIRRVREASELAVKPYEALQRDYQQETRLQQDEILALFEERLHDYGATLYRCSAADLPQAIETAAAARGVMNLLVPPGFPDASLPASLSFITDQQLPYTEIDRVGSVLTSCALAIAETGTIVLRHDDQEGRRALSLIPDYHLCIVKTQQVVGSVVEGIRRCATFGRMPLTTISGPSATADIEMTRIKGVHGPRTLDVILVSAT